MKRRAIIQSAWGLACLTSRPVFAATANPVTPVLWREITFTGLGTLMSIRAAHTQAAVLDQALAAARQVVERIEDQMSLFRPDSAIRRLNRDGELRQPDPDLLRLLQRSQHIAQHSRGAFDITVQPLWQLYAQAQQHGRVPTRAQVQTTRLRVGWQHLRVTPERIAFYRPGMCITLNGIAQGHAADRVRETLQAHGIAHALINTGEWSSLGQSPAQRDWVLGVADPRANDQLVTRLAMQGQCVATSADNQCAFTTDRRHHHIFNPHTGCSPPDLASVTVVAADCTLADALTKVLFVAGHARALTVAQAWQADALVIRKTGQLQSSRGLRHTLV